VGGSRWVMLGLDAVFHWGSTAYIGAGDTDNGWQDMDRTGQVTAQERWQDRTGDRKGQDRTGDRTGQDRTGQKGKEKRTVSRQTIILTFTM
jgi:hypothetical protein